MNKEKIFRIVGSIIAIIVMFFTGRLIHKSNKETNEICKKNAEVTEKTAETITKCKDTLKETEETIKIIKEHQSNIDKLLSVLNEE